MSVVYGKDTPKLGFGLMRLPKRGFAIDVEQVKTMVDLFLDAGFTYFDTAFVYPGSEPAIRKALVERHPRDSFTLATKLNARVAPTEKAAKKQFTASLERTGAGYFDYYLLHALMENNYERYEKFRLWDFVREQKEKGLIRNLGFSFHGAKSDFDELIALHEKYHWDFVQIEMNYLDWRHAKAPFNTNAEYLYNELEKRGIPMVIMEPLLGGRLAKLPDAATEKLLQREPAKSVASWAFRFVGSYPGVLCCLSGMTNAEVLQDNLQTFSGFKPLTDEEKEFLMGVADLLDSFPTVPCTGCQYCMPCPYGIDIPGIFRHYNEMVRTGSMVTTANQDDFRRLRRKYLVSYDRAIETVRQADHCIHCRQCMSHCPQSIRIPGELSRIAKYVENLRKGSF